MVKEAMCSNKLCECLAEVGMPMFARTGLFGKVHYECSLAQAMRWFREKRGIHIEIHWFKDDTWCPQLVSDDPDDEDWDMYFSSYEEAVEAGLYLAIKKVGGNIEIDKWYV